ncbi:hypothetical protein ACFL0V_07045 [Nanoarchaeota archaeon]
MRDLRDVNMQLPQIIDSYRLLEENTPPVHPDFIHELWRREHEELNRPPDHDRRVVVIIPQDPGTEYDPTPSPQRGYDIFPIINPN